MRTCPQCGRTYPDEAEFCLKDGTALPPAPGFTEAALAGSLARRYRIIKKLGAGGMGSVFLAEQISLGNRPVALKVLSRRLLDDPEFLQRFHNEGASTARIQHHNVVTIYESGQADDGSPYIAMEYLKGEPLRDVLRRQGALPVAQCAEILQQAARGLNAAHKLGIIHRDLKPDNLFLTHGDEGELVVKVVDFGLAKMRESATHTQTGVVLGTPAYMSYEQAYGTPSDQLDARSDVYSLGIVVYEMLTGRVPFHSDTPQGYLRKHIMDAPPPFRAIAPSLPASPQVEAVVMKALAKDRSQRYASALEFAEEFARVATAPLSVESPSPFATTKKTEPAGAPPRGGASSARPEAEGRSPLQPASSSAPQPVGTSARSSPPEARSVEVGVVREPPRRDTVGRPAAEKKFPAVWAILLAATVVVIAAALAWRYWPVSPKPPVAPQQATSVPATAQTPTAAPVVNNPPTNPSSPQVNPAQIVVQASPNAQVYLDDTFKGQVGRKGRLLIDDPKPGDHALRVSLAGKRDFEKTVTVAAGQVTTITATLRDTVRENFKDGLKYVWVAPGTFMMGCSPKDNACSDDEKPSHKVTISRGFWMGQTPVTVGAYKRFAGATGRQMPPEPNISGRALNPGWGNNALPMVDVNWDEAQAYCRWAGGRLPTEAEWEYAARGESRESRYGSLDDVAWYADNSGLQRLDSTAIDQKNYDQRLKDNSNGMHEVGLKRPNALGLYDVLGNVRQWVNDWYDPSYYQISPAQDPQGAASGQYRVLRGGSWYLNPRIARVSNRGWYPPTNRYIGSGFRCSGEVGNP
ncbi:MAG TPA: SUMF1/EgtB/PvdO family nonheme iron enzyme [Terriglobia bacterium]|nr:SUMF1/EgtB/PvdO family nonheme iron enzyme [Terriglobia bacterium]